MINLMTGEPILPARTANQYLARYWFAVRAGKIGSPVMRFIIKRTRRCRRSKRVKVAAAKRATQAHTLRTRKPSVDVVLNDSKNADHAGEQEAQNQGSSTAIKAVDVPRMSAYFWKRTRTGKSFERFIPMSQLF
jgi:hypothetical protein